jgi:quercetin 2,3-dioxygenase
MIRRELPGTKEPYLLRAGEGERHLVGGLLTTAIARSQDTGDLVDLVVVSGGKGAAFPAHRHATWHEALLVLEGRVDLSIDGVVHSLGAGDYANLPPGTRHGFTCRRHQTRMLTWTIGGAGSALYARLGEPYRGFVCPPADGRQVTAAQLQQVSGDVDVTVDPAAPAGARVVSVVDLPDTAVPFVLEQGEGTRLLVADQLFTFLGHQGNSHGQFITLMTAGPRGERIPMHFHEKHTETFFCVHGAMTMWANGQEVSLLPGDFMHVPAGTVHSYRLDGHDTRFMGVLTPGLFEPFFRTLGDPYEPHQFPLEPWPFRMDRVGPRMHEFDLKFVEDPRAVPKRGES